MPSNWRSVKSLHQLMVEKNLVGIQGLDTRAITKHIRSAGVTMGVMATTPPPPWPSFGK